MSSLLASPRAIDYAKLPELYQEARRALSTCARFDECREWNDRAAALASYARQAKDKVLLRYAVRIRARAVRRVGELLIAVKPQKNQHGGTTKKQTAESVGLSRDQARTAQRVARVPEAVFERAIDGAKPPSLVALARIGTAKRATTTNVDAVARARAQLRLKKALRELEEVAADFDAIESPAEHFGRLIKRDGTLRSQLKHARIFLAQLEDWSRS